MGVAAREIDLIRPDPGALAIAFASLALIRSRSAVRIVTAPEPDSTVRALAKQGESTPTNGVRIWPMKPGQGARGLGREVNLGQADADRAGRGGLRGAASSRSRVLR